ncbi:LAMI_0E12156g1_1 [Lachancea mirantina]|uniref:Pheromone-regulated membrane protein 10 n=1 Tax=Lachancea mirantina TaxID=1230905 RepID=A0A1G4JQB7_9SACH|nr:LAMI_0E12156g1_1 [Lachancea mirantina]
MSDKRPGLSNQKSSDRFRFLRSRSPAGNAPQGPASGATAYDSSSDDEAAEPVRATSSLALPSFNQGSSQAAGRQQMIEQDAVDTIRLNSGNDGDSDPGEDVAQDLALQEQMRRDYETKRARFADLPHEDEDQVDDDDKLAHHDEADLTDMRGETRSAKTKRNSETPSFQEDEKDNNDTSSSTASDEDKVDHFKSFFRRRSTLRRQSNDSRPSHGMRSLREEDEDDGNVLSKFLQFTGGGLTPALGRTESQKSKPDPEKIGGQENLDAPLEDPDIKEAAQNIVQSHANDDRARRGENSPNHLQVPSDVDPAVSLSDGETAVNSSHSSFFASRVGHYDDIDQQEDFDPLMEDSSFIAPPSRVRGGVLGSLLKLYQNEQDTATQSQISLDQPTDTEATDSLLASRSETPEADGQKKSKKISFNTPFSTVKNKAKSGFEYAEHAGNSLTKLPNFKATRPKMKNVKNVTRHANKLRRRANAEARITVHIADLLQRQRFILRLCKALMLYGAPTHRLEEYMVMTSRVMEIDGQFLYIPGCMVVSFGDATTRTSEVQLVRCAQGLNLWKLHEVHSVYKSVIHDLCPVEDANNAIDNILKEKNLYPPWVCVILYGVCSSFVTPFAFGGDWINMATSFVIGTCVGFMQFIVAQRSSLYSNVFEVTASIVVSFCARALGSIAPGKSNICFGATAQGSLALILPGYIILCGSLELQSRNLVAGSVRMFYAIIYSLFLGFGITLGAALFGWIYKSATNETTCAKSVSPWYRFLFVPAFSIGLGLINQAKWSQLPVMTFISCCGYVVTYFSGLHFKNSTEFNSALAAFIIGILGNLYSRIWKGLAVSAMLPGIFVQVPSGVASQSSLLAGIQSANQITNHTKGANDGTSDLSGSMSFGVTMIQVSIGISVGLFASTLFVYPFGKKRTSLFTL